MKKLINRQCKVCNKKFKPLNAYKGYSFYCSRECFGKSQKGRRPWNKGIRAIDDIRIANFVNAGHEATKGQIPWNKNLTWGNSGWLRKNDPNKYRLIHKRVYKKFGAPDTCEHCSKKGNNRQIHWANINARYTEDRKDWIRLCVSCHIKFDGSNKTAMEILK